MRKLGEENFGGRKRTWFKDGTDFVLHTEQDVEPVIEMNKRAFNEAPERFGNAPFHRVASIPVEVVERTARERGIPFAEFTQCKSDRAAKAWRMLLNDRDLRYFRTRPGYVDVKAK